MGAEVTFQDATGGSLDSGAGKQRTAPVCHSYHYKDPEGNRVELQLGNFEIPSGD